MLCMIMHSTNIANAQELCYNMSYGESCKTALLFQNKANYRGIYRGNYEELYKNIYMHYVMLINKWMRDFIFAKN